MTRPAIGTIATRVVVMATNLLVMAVAGHALGAEGLGTIGLVVLGIALIMLLNNVAGGGAMVYLSTRLPLGRLLPFCYVWALGTAVVALGVLWMLPLVPKGYAGHVVALALLQSFHTVHTGVLLGRERFRTHNTIAVAQALSLIAAFALLLGGSGPRSPMAYVYASYASFGFALLLSTLALRGLRQDAPEAHAPPVWKALLRHGGLVQTANVLQLLNYRLAYYLVEAYRGTAALGLYSVATQLAEASWVVPKSLGAVLYARVSNTGEADRQRDLTLAVLKASVAFAMAVSAGLLLLPDPVYRGVFGPEIAGLTPLLLLLAPGIVAMAASQALSHWFSGTGRNVHNAAGSGLGLAFTLAGGFLLIPAHGLPGAAFTATLAYGAATLYQLVVFLRITRTRPARLFPGAEDAARIARIWREARRR